MQFAESYLLNLCKSQTWLQLFLYFMSHLQIKTEFPSLLQQAIKYTTLFKYFQKVLLEDIMENRTVMYGCFELRKSNYKSF